MMPYWTWDCKDSVNHLRGHLDDKWRFVPQPYFNLVQKCHYMVSCTRLKRASWNLYLLLIEYLLFVIYKILWVVSYGFG